MTSGGNSSVIEVEKITLTAEPNSITQRTNEKGGIDRTFYDENRNQYKQISNYDHGKPKNHNYGENGEHAHDIVVKEGKIKNRTTRELTDQEREYNKDIL